MQRYPFETGMPLNEEWWEKNLLFLWGDLIPSMK